MSPLTIIKKQKGGVMNTKGTKGLDWVQKICAKIDMWMTEKENQVGPIVFFLPIILAFGLLAIITDVVLPTAPKFRSYIVIVGGLAITVIQVSIMKIGSKYKEYIPEYQIKKEKENLKQLVNQAEYFKANNPRAYTNTINQLIGQANIELALDRLEHILKASKRLEEFVKIIQDIEAKESKIKTLEQECERLPEEKQELAELEQKFKDHYS